MRGVALVAVKAIADTGGWDQYLALLAPVIARHDASIEPIDMLPAMQQVLACVDRPVPRSAIEEEICAKPDMRRRGDEIRQARSKAEALRQQ
jgi:hypothetical protein